jgi:hypothetical protein
MLDLVFTLIPVSIPAVAPVVNGIERPLPFRIRSAREADELIVVDGGFLMPDGYSAAACAPGGC